METFEPRKLTIDVSVMPKYNMTPGEFLITLAGMWGVDLEETLHRMVRMGTAKSELGLITPSQVAVDRLRACCADSSITVSDEEILEIANGMRELFPKGIRSDGQFWSDGAILVVDRLKNFFYKYGTYPKEDILEATRKYVEQNRNNPYMRLLKYFIYKEDERTGTTILSSDLYTYLENKEQDTGTSIVDWNVEIR